MSRPRLEAYAIVGDDDRIADAAGLMPDALRNEADWAYFQAALDRADGILIGRASHEATPNVRGRRRLVLSRSARGLVERPDGCWWNPARAPWPEVVGRLGLAGRRIAVPGGQAAFDAALALGLDAFHLSRMPGVTLPGGRGVFAAVEDGRSADAVLRAAGLAPGAPLLLDREAGVTVTVYQRGEPRPI